MSNSKKSIVIIVIFVIIIALGGYLTIKYMKSKENIEDDHKDETPIVEPEEKMLNFGRVVQDINVISQLYLTDELDENDSMTDELTNRKYYKYTGSNANEIITKLGISFENPYNNFYFKLMRIEDRLDLYVSKPENCESVVELSINNFLYDEELNQAGYIDLLVEVPEKNYGYKTILVFDNEDNTYKITEPFDTCIR